MKYEDKISKTISKVSIEVGSKPEQDKPLLNSDGVPELTGRDEFGRFLPGMQHNTTGKTRSGPQIPATLKAIGQEPATEEAKALIHAIYPNIDLSSLTMFEAFLRLQYTKALRGDARTAEFISERTEGKVSQSIEMKVQRERIQPDEDPLAYINTFVSTVQGIQDGT